MAINRLLNTFKYLILGFCIALVVVLGQGWLKSAYSQTVQQQAEELTYKGRAQLEQGQAEAALQTWQQATKLYHQLNAQEEVAGTLLNQSSALKDMGLFPRACSVLLESLKLEEWWLCDSSFNPPPKQPMQVLKQALERPAATPVSLLGLQELGTVLRRLGALEASKLVLHKALDLSDRLPADEQQGKILLRLGDTEQTYYTQARERYTTSGDQALQDEMLTVSQNSAHSALKLFRQSIVVSPQRVQLRSRLNALALMIDAQQWAARNQGFEPGLEVFRSQMQSQIQPLLNELLQTPTAFSQLPPAESVYARLNFALSLNQLQRHTEAIQSVQMALQASEAVNNPRLRSYSLGLLGQLSPQREQSQVYFEQALSLAPPTSWDIAYQWQHELGRLYQQQGERTKAYQTYSAAIESLDQGRGNLSALNADLQFSFRDKVEPIYREYMQLLLEDSNPNLQRIIEINERLQIAELENFLSCGKLNLVPLDKLQRQPNPPAVVHVLSVGDRYEVIVRSPDRSLHRYTPDADQMRTSIENLRTLVQDPNFLNTDQQTVQAKSHELYRLLLAPAREKGDIPPAGTLVFVLDSALQNIPMSILHDGQDYLVRHYSPVVAMGSQLRQPQALKPNQLRALIAGLSEKSPSFNAPNAPLNLAPLPQVITEVSDVTQQVDSAVELLNEEFTSERLQQTLERSNFPILHLTTHGEFSSNPEKTVILDWNQALDLQQINTLLRGTSQQEGSALELLVLSACQTAKGDKRSTLGLAGVAAQAGARSTLASLWLVKVASTGELMGEFYKGLQGGTPKAEALRQAQLSLLDSPESGHPFHWAGFILVGSWL